MYIFTSINETKHAKSIHELQVIYQFALHLSNIQCFTEFLSVLLKKSLNKHEGVMRVSNICPLRMWGVKLNNFIMNRSFTLYSIIVLQVQNCPLDYLTPIFTVYGRPKIICVSHSLCDLSLLSIYFLSKNNLIYLFLVSNLKVATWYKDRRGAEV